MQHARRADCSMFISAPWAIFINSVGPKTTPAALFPMHQAPTCLTAKSSRRFVKRWAARKRERERKRGGKNSQVTITAGQYFIKMKCSGTVYTAARETRRASEPTHVKLLSAGVFLARCVWRRGSGDAGGSRGPPGPSLISTERFREKNPQFFRNNRTHGPLAACCFFKFSILCFII